MRGLLVFLFHKYFNLFSNPKLVLKQDVSQYSDIVSVVKNTPFGGHCAKLIDKNGNMYNMCN